MLAAIVIENVVFLLYLCFALLCVDVEVYSSLKRFIKRKTSECFIIIKPVCYWHCERMSASILWTLLQLEVKPLPRLFVELHPLNTFVSASRVRSCEATTIRVGGYLPSIPHQPTSRQRNGENFLLDSTITAITHSATDSRNYKINRYLVIDSQKVFVRV